MKQALKAAAGLLTLLTCLSLSGCDNVRVYGGVGYSSYSGYGYGGGLGTSISVGGRIY